MKEYASALRKLHSSIDLSNEIDSILKLSAIEVFCQRLDAELEAQGSHSKAGYTQEKLGLFLSYCYYSILPDLNMDHKSPSEWLEEAGFNLIKVQSELA
jgi:hypothetical protein